MRTVFAYTRVSTVMQGQKGVSLQEQRDAISRFAERNGLEISEWFEERETAAKRGRPVFTQMLRLLRRGKARGVVIHKIDRGARNLGDWADLGELIDQGVDVHFANESLDLHSRGGRLSADIQAVVSADYVRNLREETRKGFYGRLKQGFYPLPAPIGYLDRGRAKVKEVDPARGPLVKAAFELYASGRFNLNTLREQLTKRGLRNRNGGLLSRNGLSTVLNNPFYVGLIRLISTGETFPGAHRALIAMALFQRVQQVLRGKTNTRFQTHDFVFRRLLQCGVCARALTGELQKGHVYYRCHTRNCGPVSIREDTLNEYVVSLLRPLEFSDDERTYLRHHLPLVTESWQAHCEAAEKAAALRLDQQRQRLGRLTDAFVDGMLDKPIFEERKAALLVERMQVEDQLREIKTNGDRLPERLSEFFELAASANYKYETGAPDEKRELLRIVTSNRCVFAKDPAFTLSQPFRRIAERRGNTNSCPQRDTLRTLDALIDEILEWISEAETRKILQPAV